MVMPAIAPVLSPPETCVTVVAGDEVEMEEEEEDDTTEDTALPEGRDDSAGKGSPNTISKHTPDNATLRTYQVAACTKSPSPKCAVRRYSYYCSS